MKVSSELKDNAVLVAALIAIVATLYAISALGIKLYA